MKYATKFILVPEHEYNSNSARSTRISPPTKRDYMVNEYNRGLENLGRETNASSKVNRDATNSFIMRKMNQQSGSSNRSPEDSRLLKGLESLLTKVLSKQEQRKRPADEEESDDNDTKLPLTSPHRPSKKKKGRRKSTKSTK